LSSKIECEGDGQPTSQMVTGCSFNFAGDLVSRGSNYTQYADQINKYLKRHEYSPIVSVYGWDPRFLQLPWSNNHVQTRFRETQNCLPSTIWLTVFWFWYKKTVMSKKSVISVRNLKDWTKFTTQNNENEKKEKSIFLSRQFVCFPER
jgi:hypothetical protein